MERVSITYDIILLCNDSELGDGLGRLSIYSSFAFFTPRFHTYGSLGLYNAGWI